MLLRLRFPAGVSSTQLIEELVPQRFKLKRVPLHKYYSAEALADFRQKPVSSGISFVANSPVVHGAICNGVLYVHPQSLVRYLARRFSRQLKSDSLTRRGLDRLRRRLRYLRR